MDHGEYVYGEKLGHVPPVKSFPKTEKPSATVANASFWWLTLAKC